MAIDPRIILGLQSPQLDNPVDTMSKVMQMKRLVQQNELADEEFAEKRGIKDAMTKNVLTGADGKTKLNRSAAISELTKTNPAAAMNLTKLLETNDLETLKRHTSLAKQLSWSISDDNTYQAARAKAIELGLPNAERLDEVYIPATVQRWQMATLDAEEQLNRMNKRDDQDIDLGRAGYRADRDLGGSLKRDQNGRAAIYRDNGLTPDPKPLHPLEQQKLELDIRNMGEKPVQEQRKIIADKVNEGFEPVLDDKGNITGWKMSDWKKAMVDADLKAKNSAAEKNSAQAKRAGRTGTGAGKPPKADQMKAAGYVRRLEQAENIFGNLEQQGYDRTSRWEEIKSMAPGEVQGGKLATQSQAERNFINAVLRRESGAAIGKDEFASAAKQYFPRPGDTPEVIANKRANRLQVIATLKAESGRAYDMVPLISPTGTGGGTKVINGVTYKKVQGGWQKVK